jgi:hypothetical protein
MIGFAGEKGTGTVGAVRQLFLFLFHQQNLKG